MRIRSREMMTDSRRPATALQRIRPQRPPTNRPQRQERLTKQIADWLDAQLQPRGVGVVIEAEHSCMTLRGVQAPGSATITSTLLGVLREDPRSRQEFFALAGANT